MTRVTVIATGRVREMLGGLTTRELALEGETVEDLLKSITTKDGTSLFKLMVGEQGTQDEYLIRWVRGDLRPSNLYSMKDLKLKLEEGDRIYLMSNPPLVGGG